MDKVEYNDLATDLTLIGITGIEDPLREGVRQAVAKCKMAGVHVAMCTGDNVLTARRSHSNAASTLPEVLSWKDLISAPLRRCP